MATPQSLFHKTESGHRACEAAGSLLPPEYRAALRAVQHATPFDVVRACLGQCTSSEVARYLEDLEAIGLIESVSSEWLRELYALGAY